MKDDMNYISTLYAKKREDARRIELNSVYQDRRKTPHVLMSPFKEFFKRVVAQEWDLLITGEVGRTDVEDIARFARTQDELLVSFYQFCRKNVGDYEPGQSSEMIRSAIYEFFEDYLGMPQNDAIKVVLYHLNKPKFAAYLAKAEARYAEEYEKREQERNPEVYVPFTWELPDTRMYNSEVSHHCADIYHHTLLPFFEENRVSEPEYKFSRMLDKNNEVIDWWYKNADSGHMHFAVAVSENYVEIRHFTIIDEAHYMLSFDNRPLRNLIAVGRNKGLSIILATQNMDDFKSKSFDFYANAQYPLIMKQQSISDGVLKDIFGVSGKDFLDLKAAISGLQKGELVIKDNTADILGIGKKWKKIKVSHLI